MREHAEAIRPPRSLWVPFPLGRPLGVPNDPIFQKRVVISALKLLEYPSGPVLKDFPEDLPSIVEVESQEGMACPISFSLDMSKATQLEKVVAEISQLRAWHDLFIKSHGKTATGVAGEVLEDLAKFVFAWAEGKSRNSFRDDIPLLDALRLACDELKAFYSESVQAQPGTHSIESIQDWFWGQTMAGALLFDLHAAMLKSGDKREMFFADNVLVPRRIQHTMGTKQNNLLL